MRVLSDHHISKEEFVEVKSSAEHAAVDAAKALALYNSLISKLYLTYAITGVAVFASCVSLVLFINLV